MSDDCDPTRAERTALRVLADLGGGGRTDEIRDHPDYTTMTHYYELRDDGYVDDYDVGPLEDQRMKRWRLTDDGFDVVRDEADDWLAAVQAVEVEDLEVEV